MMNDNLTQMSDPQLNSMTPGLTHIVYSSSRFCVTQIHVLLLNMAGHSRISEYMIIVAPNLYTENLKKSKNNRNSFLN